MGPEAGFSGARTAVDALLFELGATATWAPTAHPSFIPGRTAQIQTDTGITGIVGELHPEVLLAFGLEQPVALVELVLLPLDFA
jgi:phenylalanyl-tRNA synthetase beta chain